ncbi:MAG: FHA domain-containing protein [Actinomycetota bacterium]
MYCTSCGHRNPESARFCARCGSSLSAAGDDTTISLHPEELDVEEPAVSVESLRSDQALLLVKRGMSAGSTFLLDKDVTSAGRSPSSDIFLDDVTVSRRHAEILRDGHRFVVKDAGSLNGTYVNRERVDVAELSGGDELQIGKFKLVFLAGAAEA